MTTPRTRAAFQACVLVGVMVLLFLAFPRAFQFVEMAGRELRYLWWLILLLALGIWFLWANTRKPRA